MKLETLSIKKYTESIKVDNINFAAAHRVPLHPGKCSKLHGHNYSVSATIVYDPHLNPRGRGYFIDFGVLKANLKYFVDTHFDHKTILHTSDGKLGQSIAAGSGDPHSVFYTEKPPTAETLAELIAHSVYDHTIVPVLRGVNLDHSYPNLSIIVDVRESPNCVATVNFELGEWI